MTKKDYIVIAKAISEASSDETKRLIALRIADALAADNDRFDRATFLDACGESA